MLAFVATLSALATAQTPPYRCGPDCSTPGRYVLCRDTFDASSMSAGGVQLTGFLDSACVTFDPPAPMFSLTGFAALFGPGDMLIGLIEIFDENGVPAPGDRLGDTGAAIPASNGTDFSGLFFGAITLDSPFRMCMRQQLDDPVGTMLVRPMLFDGDGVQGQNWAYNAPNWTDANATFPGDLVFRAVVEYNDLTPWQAGGPCEMRDGGVPADSGISVEDGGQTIDEDGGAGGDDSGRPGGDDGGGGDHDTGGSTDPAPTITAISPDRGPNTQTTNVIVSGTGFVAGLSLKIGSIAAENVDVAGPATISAVVPANINGGVYDVIVQNPDGQAAILPKGYTVLDPGNQTPGNAADDCGCSEVANRPSSTLLLLGVPMLLFLRPDRERRRRRRDDDRE